MCATSRPVLAIEDRAQNMGRCVPDTPAHMASRPDGYRLGVTMAIRTRRFHARAALH